ncbi:response regulator transcription factor [Chitinophaga sp. GbtcB8]|uniref:response regulator transcription factor n=1 Tax=Chitinophaga sp. GbtcB8 TaxID=2824753 RepID=UPI001C2FCE4F|nr:response regulator transcription factor [Chitinophaga sp. GbtcB8]
MTPKSHVKLALVDDHKLFRKGLRNLIELANSDYCVLFEAGSGRELQQKITAENEPDVILMDIHMPDMDGFVTVEWLIEHFPLVKVLIVSMAQKEETIVKMLKLGVKGFLSKDVEPQELGAAIDSVVNKGYYYTDFITGKLVHSLQRGDEGNGRNARPPAMSDREREFLKFACTELTYNEIASKMFLSPKTIDGYRNALFEKLNVRSRVGLAVYAIKNGFVQV